MSERYHWAPAARMILVVAEQLGVPKEQVIRHAGVDAAELVPRRFRMPWAPLRALTQSAIELTAEPAIGLLAGQLVQRDYHGVAGVYYMNSSPLRESQRVAYEEVIPRVSNLMRFWHEENGEVALNCVAAIPPVDPIVEVHMQLYLSTHIFGMRAVFGEETRLVQLSLRSTTLGDPERIARMLRLPVALGQPLDCLAIPREMLERPLPLADPWVRELLRPQFDAFLRELEEDLDMTLAVEGALARALATNASSDLNAVAKRLKLKPRTLRGKLVAEGTTFKQLLDAARKEFSLRKLAEPGTTAAAVSTQAGFSDAAAFSRAFRRWTGTTPGEWRESRLNAKPGGDVVA